jgi:transglutaminase-like putative cysteine protease
MRALMGAIHGELVFDPSATHVQTRADEVLVLGRGVCQDFTHVLLAACRSLGIALALRQRLSLRLEARGRERPPHTRGWTCGTRSGGGVRSTPRTTAIRRRATCASRSAGTTPTCRRHAEPTGAAPRRRCRCESGCRRSESPALSAPAQTTWTGVPTGSSSATMRMSESLDTRTQPWLTEPLAPPPACQP